MAKDRIDRAELAGKLLESAAGAEDPLRAMAENGTDGTVHGWAGGGGLGEIEAGQSGQLPSGERLVPAALKARLTVQRRERGPAFARTAARVSGPCAAPRGPCAAGETAAAAAMGPLVPAALRVASLAMRKTARSRGPSARFTRGSEGAVSGVRAANGGRRSPERRPE
jgi:hypothetical protein